MHPALRSGCLKFCQQRLIGWLAVLAAGAATPLAFAPYRHSWLMPLLWGILLLFAHWQPQRRVWLAYLWGLAAYTSQFYWINIALHDVSGLPQLYALPLTLLLPAYLALYPALCFWAWEKIRLPALWRWALALPLLWTLTEFIRERALTGFGWGALGYSQIAESPLAGFAPIGGVMLVTLAVACVGAWGCYALFTRDFRHSVLAVCSIIALYLLGHHFTQINFTEPDGSQARVALAQGNIKQTLKWQPDQLAPTIQRYYDQVAQTQADILILPETAIPVMRQDLPEGVISQFASTAQRNQTALALGIAQYTASGQGYLNAVVNLSEYHPDRPDDLPTYAKDHLVPFGEYIPLPQLTGWLYRLLNMPLAGFSQGGKAQPPMQLANQKVAFNICYEDSFGDELIASARQASLLANVSNMAWYGDSNAMDQHLQQSQTRALELGRYMVRATNTGATAVIAPDGQITALADSNTATVLTATVQGYRGQTPYMQMGGSWPLAYAIGAVLLLLWAASLWRIFGTQKPV